jgi:anti-sigma factor (TIGR02949 family)
LEPIKPLTCFEALQRLEDYLDRELSPRDLTTVEGHLAICATCTREFAFETGLLQGIRARLQRAPLPEDLRRRIAAVLRGEATPPPDS